MKITKTIKGWKLPLIAGVALLFALYSVAARKPASHHPPIAQPPISEYDKSISGIGVIEPKSELITVSSDLSGIIRQVHVKVGQYVKIGQPLFSLDQRDIDAQILTLKANVDSAKAAANNINAQYIDIQSLSDGQAISREEYRRRKYAAESATAQFNQAKAQLNQALITKQRLTVCAPITGEILSVNTRPGEYASTTQAEPLIRMGDTQTLHVRVEIDEYNANRVTPTANAIAYLRGNPHQKITLQFVRIEPYVKPKQNLSAGGQRVDTRVVQLIYAIKNRPKNIFTGQQVDVFIDGESK